MALVLATALAVQLLTPADAEPPLAGPVGGGRAARAVVPSATPVMIDPAILARAMFAPAASGAADGQAAAPLAGYTVVGAVRIGRRAYAVVRAPDQRMIKVRPGGRIGDWRLAALTADSAMLVRGDERLAVRFGTQAPTASNSTVEGT
jgi:hypothetical protein